MKIEIPGKLVVEIEDGEISPIKKRRFNPNPREFKDLIPETSL